jgi:hypothetical protein
MSCGTQIYDQRNSEDLDKEFCLLDQKRTSSSLRTISWWGSLPISICIHLTVGTLSIMLRPQNDYCKAQRWLYQLLIDLMIATSGSSVHILLFHTSNS